MILCKQKEVCSLRSLGPGRGGVLGSIVAGYVPLTDSVAYCRPYFCYFRGNVNFAIPT